MTMTREQAGDHRTAYLEGRQAYAKGTLIEDNPYTINTVRARAWEEGWMDADDHANGGDGETLK